MKFWFSTTAQKYTILLLIVSAVAVYGLSFYKRQATYADWLENAQYYVVEDVTAMSTMDAYYWLKMARELDAGTLGVGKLEPTRGYPDLAPIAFKGEPGLLAELISFGKRFTGGDYYRAGLLLVPILSGLFVFPLCFYFGRIGFGASAILGGLVGTFSSAYYSRTMMGQVDTDLLNTFFPLMLACFILLLQRENSLRINLLLAMGAGITMSLFVDWFQKPGLILVYVTVMAAYLLISRMALKRTVLILFVFILLSGPGDLLLVVDSVRMFLRGYLFPPPPVGTISWPNIMTIVSESQKLGLQNTLAILHGFQPLVYAGFAGLGYLAFRHFRQMIPLSPMLALGLWSLVGPPRFAMYLACFIGVGIGVLLELLVRYAGQKAHFSSAAMALCTLVLSCAIFFSTSAHTGINAVPRPSVDAATTRALLEIKRIVPQHAAMFTPEWEFGYPLMEIGDFATYNDGGLQGGMRTTLIAQSIMSPRQKDMVSLISYLEDFGFKPLAKKIREEKLDADEMQDLVFNYPEPFNGEDIYVLYLEDTIWEFDAMAFFGTWDYRERKSQPLIYIELECFSRANNIISCRDGTIDLDRGLMNDGTRDIPMSAALFVNDGYVVEEKTYNHRDGYYLQVLMKKGKVYTTLVASQQIFQSSFNQQFLLGRYDRQYFEEVYNDFPVARLFKVEKTKALAE